MHMVGARGRHSVAQSLAVPRARLVHRQRLSFDVQHVRVSAVADLLSRPGRTLSQQVAETLPFADLPRQLHHRLAVAKVQRQAAGVLQRQQAVLKALHCKGDGHAGGNGVQTIGVAELVGLGDGPQVVDAAVGAKGADRLVLGAAVRASDLILVIIHLHLALAVDGAGITRGPVDQERVPQRLATDKFRTFELPVLEVACGQRADGVEIHQPARRTQIAHPLACVFPMLAHPLRQP